MAIGRTIKLFLVEGSPHGVLSAEISNWSGKALVCPRSQLEKLVNRDEACRTGVYALVGPDPENPFRDRVYLGESDNVFDRLRQHGRDSGKDFWTRAVLISSKDENLTKAHVLYLEEQLISRAQVADRAVLENSALRRDRRLPESDMADMEFFLGQIELLLPVLGFNFIQATTAQAVRVSTDAPVFVMTRAGVLAKAKEINGEFVVLAGSTARAETQEWMTAYRSSRPLLLSEGKLRPSSDLTFLEFAENVPFASPSAAAAVVNGGNANGRTEWKVETTGQTYGEWQDAKLVEPVVDDVTQA